MIIDKRIVINTDIVESVPTTIAGQRPFNVHHTLQREVEGGFYRVWSQRIELQKGIPLTYDMAKLYLPNASYTIDLVSGQELRWVSINHINGPGLGLLTFVADNAQQMDQVIIGPKRTSVAFGEEGHLFALPVYQFTITPMTGDVVIDLILATQKQLVQTQRVDIKGASMA